MYKLEREHFWYVTCTEEQLVVLMLSCGASVSANLTEDNRRSGLAKLTADEKEALGLA